MGNKYLKENKKAKLVLKIIGFIALPSGVISTITGFRSIFGEKHYSQHPIFSSDPTFLQEKPHLIFIGFILIFIGLSCLGYAYMGKVARYTASEMAPVAKDTTNYMIDGTKEEIVDLVSKIKGNNQKSCPYCGDDNDFDAIFCDNCGRSLSVTCACGTVNQANSRYCKKCGKKI